MCRVQKSKKSRENDIFFANYLVISKKSSTFAPAFEKKHGPLAQLNRVPHYGCGGCRFESCTDHKATSNRGFFCLYISASEAGERYENPQDGFGMDT